MLQPSWSRSERKFGTPLCQTLNANEIGNSLICPFNLSWFNLCFVICLLIGQMMGSWPIKGIPLNFFRQMDQGPTYGGERWSPPQQLKKARKAGYFPVSSKIEYIKSRTSPKTSFEGAFWAFFGHKYIELKSKRIGTFSITLQNIPLNSSGLAPSPSKPIGPYRTFLKSQYDFKMKISMVSSFFIGIWVFTKHFIGVI